MTAGAHREIQLTRGFVALVDAADFEWIGRWKWIAQVGAGGVYAVRKGSTALVRMHRELLSAEPGALVDHINGDGLDNRRANLRLCDHASNMKNRKMHRSNRCGFKGVRQQKGRRWEATISSDRRVIFLGMFDTAEAAARAYDAAALIHHGEYARLNFPEAA